MQESAAQQILPQFLCIVLAKQHLPDFDGINKREFVEILIQNLHDIRVWMHANAGQTMDRTHELAVPARIVRRPTPSLNRKEIPTAKLWTPELHLGRSHRSASSSPAAKRILCVN